MQMTKIKFRDWVRMCWQENCMERDGFNESAHSITYYFNQYKWWLRREFRYQQGKK
jgi:hypothetical protein